MSSRNTSTVSAKPTSSGMSRRDLLKNLMAGVAGTALMPTIARGAPVRGLQSGDGPEVLWDVPLPNPSFWQITDLPAYAGGNVVLSMRDQNTFQPVLFWLDIQSHQFRGPVQVGAASQALFTPVLLDGVLYAAAVDVGLYALDAMSGAPLWLNPAPYRVSSDVALINGQLVFPTSDGKIVALDTSGNQLWSYSTGLSVGDNHTSRATFLNGAVIVSFMNTVYAVDADSGAFLWKYSASDNINGDLAVSSSAVHFSTIDDKVWGIQSDGTFGWSWPNANNPLSTSPGPPVVSGNLLYVADSAGEFFAINPTDGSLAWRISLGTSGGNANIFVEDGVAYVSAGLISDSKLFAIDLTTQGSRVISQDLASYGQFIGVENGVAYYTHNTQKNIAAADFAGQLHQFFCESQLMVEDYTTSSSGSGYAGNTTSYRTHLQLLDPNYNPRVYKTVKVWASDTATLTSGGQTYTIDNNGNCAMLQTDGLGELSLVITATDLNCPALYLWGNFMEAGEAIVVYPDNDALIQLSQTTATSLQSATDYQGNQLLSDPSSAAALASTITNAMAGGPPQNTLSLRRTLPVLPRPIQQSRSRHRRRPPFGIVADSFIAYPGQVPNLWYFPNSSASTNRPYGTAAIPNFEVTFGDTITFTPTTASSVSIQQGLGLSFHDLIHNVVHGVENVAKIVYQTVQNVVNVVVTTAENVYNITVTAVEHAAAVVASALKTAIGDIKRAIQWLSYLFDWDGILQTKNQIKQAFSDNFNNWKTWLQAQRANISGLHGNLQGLNVTSSVAAGQQYVSGSIQSQQKDKNDPQDLYSMGGAKSYNQSRFLTTKVKDNAGQGQITSVSAAAVGSSSDAFVSAVEGFFTTVSQTMANNSSFQQLPADAQKAFQSFTALFTDPSQFVSNSLADFAQLFKDIGGTLVGLADAIVESLIQLLLNVIDLVTDLLNVTIQIPFVSDLYQLIAKSPLTVLDLCALMVAIPTHIISAALSEGSSQAKSTLVGAFPTPQELAWFVSCGLQDIFFTLGDTFAIAGASLYGRIIAGVNCLVLATGFPSDFATNTDFSYIFYSIKAFPPLLSVFNSIGATSPVAVAIKVATPQILCNQGICSFIMAIVFAAIGKASFIGKDYMQLVVNGLQCIPFIAKPLANGEACSVQRLALGLIDGASFTGAVGVAIAQQALT